MPPAHRPPTAALPRRVALVSHGYPPRRGGVERHVAELARGFLARGIEVEVATCDPTRELPTREVVDGVLVHRFPTLANDEVFYASPALGRWLWANARRFSILHAHSYHTPLALQALVAARAAGRPMALTTHYHGTGHAPLRRALHVPYRPFGTLVVRHSRPLICVSQAERSLLQRDFGDDLRVVIAPNGIDVDEILHADPMPWPSTGRILLSAGRLEAYKQVGRVVEALLRLPDDQLVVLGDGPASDDLRAHVADLGLTDRVRMLGHVPVHELHRWFRTADVFVSLSRHEAFGITVLEAGAGGAGVVASGIPAHREVAGYLPAGRVSLVDPDASSEELAAVIRSVGRAELDAAALARVPRWSDTVDRTLAAYERVLAAPAGVTG